jgi:predicted AAA+ superfamily ATPase
VDHHSFPHDFTVAPAELADTELREAISAADGLLLYRGVLDDATSRVYLELLRAIVEKAGSAMIRSRAAELFRNLTAGPRSGLAGSPDAWQRHLIGRILHDDNPFSRSAGAASFEAIPAGIRRAARHDLAALGQLAAIGGARLGALLRASVGDTSWTNLDELDSPATLPEFAARLLTSQGVGWPELLPELAAHYRRFGVGRFAAHRAFRWAKGKLTPIDRPDPITFDDLIGYADQRQTVRRNTEHFLQGLPSQNLLLYGERGTGKSSTVKALLHVYGDHGLRLIEVPKSSLGDYGEIVAELATRSERFLLFVDDLSFDENESGYTELKAVLEGGIAARPANVLIYATSNRRHLILERFGDRAAPDDEIHAQDTLQEKLSLADRFGLTVIFLAPDQQLYLEIVTGLVQRRGLAIGDADLRRRALQWAAWNNGRSGRTARQFVDELTAEVGEGSLSYP